MEFVQESAEEPHVLEAHIRSIRRGTNVAEIAKQRGGTRGVPATRTRGSSTWSASARASPVAGGCADSSSHEPRSRRLRESCYVLARHHCIDLEHCSNRDLSDSATCGRRSVIHSLLTVPHHVQDDDGASLRSRADDPVAVARRSNVQEQFTDERLDDAAPQGHVDS